MTERKFTATVMRMGTRDCRIRISVELEYDPISDPLAIWMTFTESDGHEVTWVASQSHFVLGARSETIVGQGDVRFRYDKEIDGMVVCLRSRDERFVDQEAHIDILLPSEDVYAFLEDASPDFKLGEQRTSEYVDQVIYELLED